MDNLIKFFNSNFFVALSTIGTVLWAIFVYKRQREEDKQHISRLLVNEIRNAENAITKLKERTESIDIPEIIILPQNSWNKYSHLFTKDFDQDETQSINNFYSDVERANYIVSQGNSMELFLLQIRQRSNGIQKKIMDILESSDTEQAQKNVDLFTSKLSKGLFHYAPQGFNTRLDSYLKKIKFILNTPAGAKLKRIAGLTK